jgi:ketosteroid isomerase-like protein
MSQEIVAKVRKGIDDFNRRNFDRALAAMREDVTWEPFLSRAETSLPLRGKEQIRAAWESQAEAVDLRVEPEEFIAFGDEKVVVPMRVVTRGRRSEMSLAARITLVWTFDGNGMGAKVELFESREDALNAARPPD